MVLFFVEGLIMWLLYVSSFEGCCVNEPRCRQQTSGRFLATHFCKSEHDRRREQPHSYEYTRGLITDTMLLPVSSGVPGGTS